MIWKTCELQILTGSEEDALGKPVGGTWETALSLYCRETPWTDEQIALEGRDVTRDEQRFIVPVPRVDFPACTHIVVDGVQFKITEKSALGARWTMVQAKVYKEPYHVGV